MTRTAILIESSNVLGEDDLPGARVDIENWQNFLKSSLGGSWNDDEIIVLRKPLSTTLEEHLAQAGDYCFLAFSGHGCEGEIALNDYRKSYPLNRIDPPSSKSTIIIDSCRGLVEATAYNFSAKASHQQVMAEQQSITIANASEGKQTLIQKSASSKSPQYVRAFSRAMYDIKLASSTNGQVNMYSCAAGESAGDDANAGGYYTSALLAAAEDYAKSNSSKNVLTTLEAHDYAASIMPPQQNPEYIPRSLFFPFAIK